MRALTLVLLSLAAWPVLASPVYKWADAQGQVHYSQTPPPNGATAMQGPASLRPGVSVQAPASPSPKAAAPVAAANPAETAPAVESKADQAKRCTEARQRVAYLEEKTARRLMVTQADGSEARMTEEEFEKRMAKAREAGKGC